MRNIDKKYMPLINIATEFVENHWDEIDKKRTDIRDSKEYVLNFIQNDVYEASWIISEVMAWGCDKNYLKEYKIYCEDALVISIEGKYFKFKGDCFEPVKPKKKTVIYFD